MHRHSWKLFLLIIAIGAAGSSLVFARNQPEDINQLLVQGHFWYARGHNNLAINAWRKVLRAQPANPEALYGLEEISEYDPESIDRSQLRIARSLARQGKFDEALAAYKAAFNGKPKTSFHAAEYFEILSSKTDRWKDAHLGLRKLVERYPSNVEYRLSLGRVESYREKTRRSAIKRFEELYTEPELNKEISDKLQSSWHDALLWLAAKKPDIPYFETFLKTFPDSSKIEENLARLKIPEKNTTQGAFALLKTGKLKQAASGFRAALQRTPDDADALEGLGLVRLEQKRYSEAVGYLEQAIQLNPKKSDPLNAALADARYWNVYQQAQKALRNKKLSRAIELSDSLLLIKPEQQEGILLRAQLAAEQEQYSSAVEYYRQILSKEPANSTAQAGLVNALISQERKSADATSGSQAKFNALALLDQYQLPKTDYLAVKNRIEASRIHRQADAAKSPDAALILLNQAMQLDPANAWIRLDIARTYGELGNTGKEQNIKGQEILEELINKQPKNLEAHYALSLYHNGYQRWQQSLEALQNIPPAARTEQQQNLARTLAARIQLENAQQNLASGDRKSALDAVTKLSTELAGNPTLQLSYAELLYDLGEQNQAFEVAAQAVAITQNTPAEQTALQMRNAALLLKMGKEKELESVLPSLRATANSSSQALSQSQLKSLRELELGFALQQAEHLLADGEAESAHKRLSSFVEEFNENSDFQLMLAAVYHQLNQPQQALALYRNVLAEDPQNMTAATGAYGSAMALKEYKLAESITTAALTEHPDHPKLLTQLSRLKLLQGKNAAARQQLNTALNSPTTDRQAKAWRNEANALLETLEQEKGPWIEVAAAARARGNDSGLDKLKEISIPVTFQRGLGSGKLLTLGMRHVDLDSRSLSPLDSSRYGSLILAGNNPDVSATTDHSSGVATSLKLSSDSWAADIGTTPRNFSVNNLVGGVKWRLPSYGYSLDVAISRRSVKESLLSYAGAYDPSSGTSWGGVTRNGGELNFQSTSGKTTLYSDLGLFGLSGDGVRDNSETSLAGGLRWPLNRTDEQMTSVGLHLSYRDFKHNLGFFTLGHGGYFSPKNYMALSIPFEFQKQHGKFDYRLNLSVGLQRFDQAAATVFPDNPALQQELVALSASDSSIATGHAQAENSSGVYTFEGEIGYSVDKRLVLGAWTFFNNTNNFDETSGGVFLRYFWNPASQHHKSIIRSIRSSEVW